MAMKLRRREVFNEINITPLTDIFLVLLIIMMVVAPLLDTSGLKLSVPSVGPAEDITEEPKVINLTISAAGEYSIDEKPVNQQTLMMELKKLKVEKPEGIVINTDPNATHEILTYAMDAAQTAGITKVAVMSSDTDGTPYNEDENPTFDSGAVDDGAAYSDDY